MTSVSCSLLEHLSLFTISSLIFGSRGCSHFTALPHTCHPFLPPRQTHTHTTTPIPGGLFLQFLKSRSLHWDGPIAGERDRVGVLESCWHLQMLRAQWNMGAIFQHVWGWTCAHAELHTNAGATTHLCVGLPESGASMCRRLLVQVLTVVVVVGGGGGLVCTFDTSLTGS